MAILGPARKILARRLLAWDRARVAAIEARGIDASAYKQRQDLADVYVDVDVATWPQEVRDLFMAVLEVTRTPTVAMQFGVSPLTTPVTRLTLAERIAYRAFAADLGVLANLRQVSPRQWADDDGEGD